MREACIVSCTESCTNCRKPLAIVDNSWQNEGWRRTLNFQPGRSQGLGVGPPYGGQAPIDKS